MKTLENAKNQVAAADILWLRGGTIANYSVQKQRTDKHGSKVAAAAVARYIFTPYIRLNRQRGDAGAAASSLTTSN